LAVVGILNSVISLYYYLQPIKTMFLDMPNGDEGVVKSEPWNYGLMGALAVATVAFGLYWAPVIALADRSLSFFSGQS